MRSPILTAVITALALGACQAKLPTSSSAAKKPAQVAAKPATPAPELVGIPVSGLVKVDAHYVIAAGGGNVIAAGGGNVIAAGGGNVIAAGGGNYHVSAADQVAIGTILPVQGMTVQVSSMLTGKPLGKPGSTDAKGQFKVAIPEGTEENVLVTASFPKNDDPRLTYALVISPKDASLHEIDEDTAQVTRYTRRVVLQRFATLIANTSQVPNLDSILEGYDLPAIAKTIGAKAFEELLAKARAAGSEKLDEVGRLKMAQRFTDALMAKITLSELTVKEGTPEPALAAMADIFAQLREAAAVKMTEDPNYFAGQDYIKNAAVKFEIKKPGDVADFLGNEFLGQVGADAFGRMGPIFSSMDMPDTQAPRLQGVARAIAVAYMTTFVLDASARTEALKAFETAN